LLDLPRIVTAEIPKMAFRIAAAVAGAAVVLFRIFVDDHRACGHGLVVVRLAVRHDHAGTLRFAAADLGGLLDMFSEIVMAYAPQHDHAVAVDQLRVLDFAAIVFVYGVPGEAECLAQPLDRRVRVAIAQAWDDRAASSLRHGGLLEWVGRQISPAARRGLVDFRRSI